jgi:predicted DNA-binding protein
MKDEDEKMARVTVRMPVTQRDQLAKRAEKAGVPMAEYVRSVLTKKVLAVEPPDELWPLMENLYSIHDMLLRIRKPEFTEAARRLEQAILNLQAELTEPRKAAS